MHSHVSHIQQHLYIRGLLTLQNYVIKEIKPFFLFFFYYPRTHTQLVLVKLPQTRQ